ncbi:hypothetical protein Tther_01146 [Tepidimonas thermarum]|uniref:Uncharacterized protein n=1 Tax=Tepidimonas thermarum TaxID=335431 RepID=A0A554X310_9BURK|nr:hypothetical protein Tther_01146 [Tepidimonas thermarum]
MDFCILSKMRRPSRTAFTMEAKLSSSKTKAAASRATSVPRQPGGGGVLHGEGLAAGPQPHHGHAVFGERAGLVHAQGGRGTQRAQGGADAADFGVGAGGAHPRHPLARDDQGAGVEIGRTVATGPRGRRLATHHLAPCNPPPLPIADDQRARAGEVAQGLDGALGFALLVQRQAQRDQHQTQQDQPFVQLPQNQVERGGGQEQQEHGFPGRLRNDGDPGAPLPAGQRIGAFTAQPVGRFGAGEALRGQVGWVRWGHGLACRRAHGPCTGSHGPKTRRVKTADREALGRSAQAQVQSTGFVAFHEVDGFGAHHGAAMDLPERCRVQLG